MMGWIIFIVIIALIVWRVKPAKGVRTISSAEVKPLLSDRNRQFVDVRTPAEYKKGHVKEFKNIPLNDLPEKVETLDPEKETFVICQSGMRSARAASLLKKEGFVHVVNVRGGMSAW